MKTSWTYRLSRITLDGPDGEVTIDGLGDHAMATLSKILTGSVRGFLRDLRAAAGAILGGGMAPRLGLEVVISREFPDRED